MMLQHFKFLDSSCTWIAESSSSNQSGHATHTAMQSLLT